MFSKVPALSSESSSNNVNDAAATGPASDDLKEPYLTPFNRWILYLTHLPFADDMREWRFPRLPGVRAAGQRLIDEYVEERVLDGNSSRSSPNPQQVNRTVVSGEVPLFGEIESKVEDLVNLDESFHIKLLWIGKEKVPMRDSGDYSMETEGNLDVLPREGQS